MSQRRNRFASLLLLLSLPALAQRDFATNSSDGRSPPGPPPEAYAACDGKRAGDTVSFTLRDGHVAQGTCDWAGNRLAVMMPPPGAGGGMRTAGPGSGDAGLDQATEQR